MIFLKGLILGILSISFFLFYLFIYKKKAKICDGIESLRRKDTYFGTFTNCLFRQDSAKHCGYP